MMSFIESAALGLTGVVAVPPLAHVLELPGKLRLSESEYRVTQRIYYPGFTVAGVAEFMAPIAVGGAWLSMPAGDPRRAPTLFALASLTGMQAVFWLITQPINRHWVEGQRLGRVGARFFSVRRRRGVPSRHFRALRNLWEGSHAIRAVLAVTGLAALVVAARRS